MLSDGIYIQIEQLTYVSGQPLASVLSLLSLAAISTELVSKEIAASDCLSCLALLHLLLLVPRPLVNLALTKICLVAQFDYLTFSPLLSICPMQCSQEYFDLAVVLSQSILRLVVREETMRSFAALRSVL